MTLVYRDGRPYLYRSKRVGRHVMSEFAASGETAFAWCAATRSIARPRRSWN